jgi:sterol 3beta-glucosyltransferase
MYSDLNQMKRMLDIFISATLQTNERAIILMPSDIKESLPDKVYLVKNIPYSWLLDKVSVVIHHCGFGTTAEVLRTGLPSIPIPHIFDQFKTANKLYKLGLSCKPLNIHKLNVDSLSLAISTIKNNKQITESTNNIGLTIRRERGVEKAVELICKHLK